MNRRMGIHNRERGRVLSNRYVTPLLTPRNSLTSLFFQAPGTFGFDHSKYRPPRGDAEFIPMDEFGRPSTRITEEPGQTDVDPSSSRFAPTAHDETPLPVRYPPPSSPAPFSDYAPTNDTIVVRPVGGKGGADVEQGRVDDDDAGGGCCKCVIM